MVDLHTDPEVPTSGLQPPSSIQQQYIVTGSVAGGMVLIIVLVMVILSVYVCYRKRQSMRGKHNLVYTVNQSCAECFVDETLLNLKLCLDFRPVC